MQYFDEAGGPQQEGESETNQKETKSKNFRFTGKMRGPVLEFDPEKVLEEYGTGEKLTEEENRKLEEDLKEYTH